MNEQTQDGGPFHPVQFMGFHPTTGEQVVREQYPGMSLRDYFAAQALVGMLAKQFGTLKENAHDAYFAADQMLKARAAK